jgi:hypothetical protein
LKPDVCRRVVGRLPSPHIQCSLQKPLWFQQRGMAPPFSFLSCETKTMVVYLVRSLGLMPESVSHDWHVQPSCQRPNRGPPKRREFSPGEPARVRIRLSSKPCKHTVLCKILSMVASHIISRRFPHRDRFGKRWQESRLEPESRFLTGLSARFGMAQLWGWALTIARNSMRLPDRSKTLLSAHILRTPRRKTEIEKRSFWRSLL